MFIINTLLRAFKVTLFAIEISRHMDIFLITYPKYILIHKCPILTYQNGRAHQPSKKVSHRFFTQKTRFVSIMVTTLFFGVSRFMFSKLPRAKGKMDISGGQINVQK
jgi:hypothetical protein